MKTMVECRVPDRVRISECSKKGKKYFETEGNYWTKCRATRLPASGARGRKEKQEQRGRKVRNQTLALRNTSHFCWNLV